AFFCGVGMGTSQTHIIAGIERDLPGNALHDPVHPARTDGIVLHVVTWIERELVVDRPLLLDRLRPVQFGLMAALGFGRIVIRLLAAARRRFGDLGTRW